MIASSIKIGRNTLIWAMLCLSLLACQPPSAELSQKPMEEAAIGRTEAAEDWHLSQEQAARVDLQLGMPSSRKVNAFVTATGMLGLPPNAYTSVNAAAAGFIRQARKYVEGDYVQKGAVLAQLENIEFVEVQRQLLETRAELTYLRAELTRQEALLSAEAGIRKNVELLRSQVDAKAALLSATEQRLRYLGIDAQALSPQQITSRVLILAPRSGYITSIALHDGLYVEPNTPLMEIIDLDHIHVELKVFESDIDKIRKGQKLRYSAPSMGDRSYEAEVHVIGKAFDTASKTVMVHAHTIGEHPAFIRDLFVEADIMLSDSTAQVLPEEAIISQGDSHFVFAATPLPQNAGAETSWDFQRIRIQPGVSESGYTAFSFLEPLPQGKEIVTAGAWYIWAEGQKEEGEAH